MPNKSVLSAIKGGLKGELDAIALYEEAASKAEGEVKDFFLGRIEEEKRHFNWLLELHALVESGKLPLSDPTEGLDELPPSPIITETFLRRLAASRWLTAALASSALLELSSVQYYRKCSDETAFPVLKSFFERLATWEDRHYHDLMKLEEETERYWFDVNNFKPF